MLNKIMIYIRNKQCALNGYHHPHSSILIMNLRQRGQEPLNTVAEEYTLSRAVTKRRIVKNCEHLNECIRGRPQ
jgi:hypothetical protein